MIEVAIQKKIKTHNGSGHLRVDHSFTSHQVTALYGPSGAGKTTFLKILAGLIPAEGKIRVNTGTWLDTAAGICLPPQKRGVGFVFQDYALFPTMTVQQHLRYGTHDQDYMDQLIAMGRLEAFLDHKPGQLSGGQQQRLAILRALSTKPGILLMDEPFSALDSTLKSAMVADLKQLLAEHGTTCLVVTHHPVETGDFADHFFEFG